jgi:hypothetical protein
MPFRPRRGRGDAPTRPLVARSGELQVCYLMWMPEMARLMTSRWISEVPSKIV